MRSWWMLGLVLVFAATAVYAAEPAKAAVETLQGTVVDNSCASGHQADMAEFVKTHTKECALMKDCAASGYILYTPDGKQVAFDAKSNQKIIKFLKKKDSKLQVEITAQLTGDKLSLKSIKNPM